MKNKKLAHSIGGVVAGLFVFALGCSDGELPSLTPEAPPNLARPACTSFTATPTEVERGGSVTLAWEVELADKVVITAGGDNAFRFETTDKISGDTRVDNIQQDTLFILTATNASLYPPECTTDEEGNVTCPAPEAPEEGTEEATAGGITVGKAEEQEEEGEESGEEESAPAPTMCRREVQVTVKAAAVSLSIESFTAEDSEIERTPNETGQTVLHWQVVPEEAVVTFSSTSGDLPVLLGPDCAINGNLQAIEQEVGEVPETYPASGCASVEISETTTYTLTATLGEETQTEMVTIVVVEEEPEAPPAPVAQIDCSDIQLTYPSSPVFSGEAVTIGWSIAEPTASYITSAKIVVAKGAKVEAAETIEEIDLTGGDDHASVSARVGLAVQFVAADGAVPCAPAVSLTVASLSHIATEPNKAVKVVEDPASTMDVYVGLDYGGFNGGKIKLWHSQNDGIEINFWELFKGYDSFTGAQSIFNLNFMREDVKTFPVHAIAKSPAGTLFTATTGVILFKKSGEGDKWEALVPLFRANVDGNYPGSHPTCLGQTQSGRTTFRDDIASLIRVCDMEVANDSLYAATDRGLFRLENVDGFLSERDGHQPGEWIGNDESNPTLENVVNDVLVVGSDVYAATSAGLFKNGENIYDPIDAYSVAVASVDDDTRIVVGSSDGVYVRIAGEWGLTLEGAVYGVAIDPYDANTVLAAGANGFYVSRDGGVTFTQVAVEGLEGAANSVAVLYSGDPREEAADYSVYLASDSGIFRADLEDVVMGEVTESAGPEESEETEEAEETESAVEVEDSDPDAGTTVGSSVSQDGFVVHEAVILQP